MMMMTMMMMNAVTQRRDLSHEFETFENRLFRNYTTKTKTPKKKAFRRFRPLLLCDDDFEERGHLHNDTSFRAFEEKTKIAHAIMEVVRQCDASLQLSKKEGTTKIKNKKNESF